MRTICPRRWYVARGLAAVLSTSVFLMTAGCITIDVFGDGEGEALEETVVRGVAGPKILLLDIDGLISGSSITETFLGSPRPSTVSRVREVLDRARTDDGVRALLLRIDSPGGTATASEQIYSEIMRFRKERRVPVTAQLLTTAASGGYYIAMAADRLQAHPTTVTGSIGVIFTSLNFAGLMEKVGIEDQTITGGIHKDVGSPFRRLSAVEREQLQSIVDDLHARFREIVERGRPELTSEQVRELANGQIYSAQQALENGLVDRLGTLEEAVESLERELGVDSSRVVAYHRPREVRRNLYTRSSLDPFSAIGTMAGAGAAASGLDPQVWALRELQRMLMRPGFHYLWWPGLSASRGGL
ncbi:MAG: signal peptide peptidase SppA [Deltaproteobacteria bacterium]|nr:signal peptide peptidase SppA [Deltaproteobacteria bacterium]